MATGFASRHSIQCPFRSSLESRCSSEPLATGLGTCGCYLSESHPLTGSCLPPAAWHRAGFVRFNAARLIGAPCLHQPATGWRFQMQHAANRRSPRRSESRAQNYSPDGAGTADLSSPTYPQPKRSAGRPSTPEGVGRFAPLTACLRCADHRDRAAGSETEKAESKCGLTLGVVIRSHLGSGVGWGRFRFADHNRTRSINQPGRDLSVRLWSANRKRRVAWFPGGCETGEFGGSVEGNRDSQGYCHYKNKKDRNVVGGRLVSAWGLS